MTASDLAAVPAAVLVYGAAWCEDTRRTRRLLRRLGVRHRYSDVDEDLEAMEQATALNKGVRRTPVVRVAGPGANTEEVLVEPSNLALTTTLIRLDVLTRELVAERLSVQNIGDVERCLRVSAGLLALAIKPQAPRPLRGPLVLTGIGLLLTGLAGWCPVFHSRGVTSLNGPGDRPDEAEDREWLRRLDRDCIG